MKHTWKVAVAAVALIGSASVARADLTISGATGLILNPTAEIVQKGHPQIQANYYDFGAYNDKDYGIFGAIQAADKLEVSGGINKYRSDASNWNRSGFAVGAKYQLLNQKTKGFGLAVGAGYDDGLQKNTHVYAAATKAFGSNSAHPSAIGTVGVRWDRFKIKYDGDSSKTSVYAGLQVPVTRTGELSVIGEIQSKNLSQSWDPDVKFPYALGLRYNPKGQAFSVTAGVQRHGIDTPWQSSPKFFAQVGYTFGK